MNQSDKSRFAESINILAATFGKELGVASLEAYWQALMDLDGEDVGRAVKTAQRTLEFFPAPVVLRRLCGEMPLEDRAIRAWISVVKAVGAHGAYASVDFDDKAINAAIRAMGGWQQLCLKNGDEFWVWAKKDFERVYMSFANKRVAEDAGEHLVGKHEHSHQLMGAEGQYPVQQISTGLVRKQIEQKSCVVSHELSGIQTEREMLSKMAHDLTEKALVDGAHMAISMSPLRDAPHSDK